MLLAWSPFFIVPIPWGLGRQRPLPSSPLCCLIAGEFKPFHSSAFRLFQVYCPMYAWPADFCHMWSSPTPMKKGEKKTVQHLMVISLIQTNSFHFWFFYCLLESIVFCFPVSSFHTFACLSTPCTSALHLREGSVAVFKGAGARLPRVWILLWPLTCCMILGELLDILVTQFPHQ